MLPSVGDDGHTEGGFFYFEGGEANAVYGDRAFFDD